MNLPQCFEGLNGEFRYQLTLIGQFARAILARKVSSNRFVIRTSRISGGGAQAGSPHLHWLLVAEGSHGLDSGGAVGGDEAGE